MSRAKNILKMNILMAMERREDRLEEVARNYMTYEKFTFQNYCDQIDEVTGKQINKVAETLLKGKATMIVSGGNTDQIPDIDFIS